MTSIENNLFQLGRAAKDISSTLETGLQNVAENLEGAFVTLGEGSAERAGCVMSWCVTCDVMCLCQVRHPDLQLLQWHSASVSSGPGLASLHTRGGHWGLREGESVWSGRPGIQARDRILSWLGIYCNFLESVIGFIKYYRFIWLIQWLLHLMSVIVCNQSSLQSDLFQQGLILNDLMAKTKSTKLDWLKYDIVTFLESLLIAIQFSKDFQPMPMLHVKTVSCPL